MIIDRQKTLNTIKTLIATRHVTVEPTLYAEWVSALDRLTPELLMVSAVEFQQSVNTSLSGLRTSHTAFLKPDTETIPLRHALCATVRRHLTAAGERWMVQDIIEDGPADLAGIAPGQVLLAKEGVPTFGNENPLFRFGGTHSLTLGTSEGIELKTVSVTVSNKPAKDRPPMIEPKALSFHFEGNQIPIIKVSTFPGTVGLPFVKKLDRLISKLAAENRNRLVIDLRGNIGGGLASLRLMMSYLCPDRRPIGYSPTRYHIRLGTKPGQLPRIGKLPESKLTQLAMLVRFRFIHKDRSIVLKLRG